MFIVLNLQDNNYKKFNTDKDTLTYIEENFGEEEYDEAIEFMYNTKINLIKHGDMCLIYLRDNKYHEELRR